MLSTVVSIGIQIACRRSPNALLGQAPLLAFPCARTDHSTSVIINVVQQLKTARFGVHLFLGSPDISYFISIDFERNQLL